MKDSLALEKFRFIYCYTDAPHAAEYILRQKNESEEVILEENAHSKDGKTEDCHVVARFSPADISKENIEETLEKCRVIVGSTKIIWVERPEWMTEESSERIKFVS